jgi:hypothetical protein
MNPNTLNTTTLLIKLSARREGSMSDLHLARRWHVHRPTELKLGIGLHGSYPGSEKYGRADRIHDIDTITGMDLISSLVQLLIEEVNPRSCQCLTGHVQHLVTNFRSPLLKSFKKPPNWIELGSGPCISSHFPKSMNELCVGVKERHAYSKGGPHEPKRP